MPGGFTHAGQGVRVVELLEKQGQGLNLTWEVRDGILNHRTSGSPATLEGHVVRLSDKIAYINHDIDDAIRAKLFTEEDLPSEYTDILGHSVRERLKYHDPRSHLSRAWTARRSPCRRGWRRLCTACGGGCLKNVYRGKTARAEEGRAQQLAAKPLSTGIWIIRTSFRGNIWIGWRPEKEELSRTVCDYVAGMTDVFAIERFKELFVPKIIQGIEAGYTKIEEAKRKQQEDFMYYPEESNRGSQKRENDIVDIISGYVKLQKKGSNYSDCVRSTTKNRLPFLSPSPSRCTTALAVESAGMCYLCDGI